MHSPQADKTIYKERYSLPARNRPECHIVMHDKRKTARPPVRPQARTAVLASNMAFLPCDEGKFAGCDGLFKITHARVSRFFCHEICIRI